MGLPKSPPSNKILNSIKKIEFLWQSITPGQKLAIISLAVVIFVFPLAIYLSLHPTSPFSRAQLPVTPPVTSTPTTTPMPDTIPVAKIAAIIYDPVLNSGQRLSQFKRWNNPANYANSILEALNESTNGKAEFRIVEQHIVDAFPEKIDGYSYTLEEYFGCIGGSEPCHSPDTIDYAKIFNDFDLANKINSRNITEVWIIGGPYFGSDEYAVKYASAITENWLCRSNGYSRPYNIPNLEKSVFVMGFNYEVGLGNALESFGHRTEGVLAQVFGNCSNQPGDTWYQDESNEWNKFSLVGPLRRPDLPYGYAHCGNVHNPPNSTRDYQHDNRAFVQSDCEDYLNYPNLTSDFQDINCNAWGCSHTGFLKWWFKHIPHKPGDSNGRLNNWWKYIIDIDNTPLRTGAGRSVSLSFNPSAKTVTPGSRFALLLNIDTKGSSITAAEINLTYNKFLLQADEVQPGPALPVSLEQASVDNNNGTISFTVGSKPEEPKKGHSILATIYFRAQQITTDSESAGVSLSHSRITAIEQETALTTTETPPARITIQTQAAPTPTPAPTTIPEAPTPTPRPQTTVTGDIDTDGDVDIFDYNILVSHFGSRMPAGGSPADLDNDGDVDIFDYNTIVTNFGTPPNQQQPPS